MSNRKEYFTVEFTDDYVKASYDSKEDTLVLKVDVAAASDCPSLSFMNTNISLSEQSALKIINVLTQALEELKS